MLRLDEVNHEFNMAAIDIAQRLSSCTANSTSISPFWGISSQVATSTSTSVTASMQEALTAIQARHLSPSQLESLGAQGQQLFLQNHLGVLPNLSFLWPQELQPLQKTLQQHQHIPQQQLQEFVFLQPRTATQLSPQAQFFLQNQVTEVIQPSSSDKTNGTSSSPSSGVSCKVAAGTSTAATGHLSLSQVQQPVSHAPQQLQPLQEQQLQQQQQQQQQQQNHNHDHHHSNTSNHLTRQNALKKHHNSITHHHNQIPTTPNSGSHIETVQPQILEHILEPSPEETICGEELKHFAKTFKHRRIELGFTQHDVALAMGKLYGKKFSPTMISRFEALNHSSKYMCTLIPLLRKWLVNADSSLTNRGSLTNPITTPEALGKLRAKKKHIGKGNREALENAFLQNPKPASEEIAMLAKSLEMEKEAVRHWFCNRRHKEKRINPPSAAMRSPTVTESAPSNMFASVANSLAGESLQSPSSLVIATGGHSFHSGIKMD